MVHSPYEGNWKQGMHTELHAAPSLSVWGKEVSLSIRKLMRPQKWGFCIHLFLLIALIFPTFLLSLGAAYATPADDFYIQQAIGRYFSLPHDAKTLSLGGTPGTICSGPQCIFLNPAGAAHPRSFAIAGTIGTGQLQGEEFLEQSAITQEQHEGFLSLTLPLGSTENGPASYGTVMAAYSRYRGTTDDSINTTPDGHRRSLGYALAVSEELALGYSFHFYDDQLRTDLADLHSHARFLHHFGAEYRVSDTTQVGLVLQYGLGQSDTEDFQLRSDGLSRPRQYSISLGASHRIDNIAILVSQDYSKLHSDGNLSEISSPAVVIGSDESGYILNTRVGAELVDLSNFSIRSGIRFQWSEYSFDRTDLQSLTGRYGALGVSGGVGYTITKKVGDPDAIRIDYGAEYSWLGNGSWEHILSLVLPFSF